jgi:hypothetical protein
LVAVADTGLFFAPTPFDTLQYRSVISRIDLDQSQNEQAASEDYWFTDGIVEALALRRELRGISGGEGRGRYFSDS